jgi:hypothetical protein
VGGEGEASSGPSSEFTRDQLIGLVAAAALARFTISMRDHRRALEAAQQADRSTMTTPLELERLAVPMDRERRRQAEKAGDQLMKRINERLEVAIEATGQDEETSGPPNRGLRYPPSEEQVFAWLLSLVGPTAVGEVGHEFARDCTDDAEVAAYAVAHMQWKRRAPLGDRVGAALLPATTAAFEELLGALVRLWLTLYPGALGVDRSQIPVGVARAYQGPDDILRAAVDNKVREVLSKAPAEWRELLKNEPGVDLGVLTDQWHLVCEVLARRNVIVHWGGRVDADYLARLPEGMARPVLGEVLVTDANYAKKTFDLFEHLGTALGVAWLAQLVPKGPVPAEQAADHLYSALKEGRYRDALVSVSSGSVQVDSRFVLGCGDTSYRCRAHLDNAAWGHRSQVGQVLRRHL